MSTSSPDELSQERLPPGSPTSATGAASAASAAAAAAAANHHHARVKKKRIRNFTADDRAAHRVFEKSRREAFKEALTNLASLLPALAETEPQRLSKHVVVDESISFIKSHRLQLHALARDRDDLLAEVNQWRSRAGLGLRQANMPEQAPAAVVAAAAAAAAGTDSTMVVDPAESEPSSGDMMAVSPTATNTNNNNNNNSNGHRAGKSSVAVADVAAAVPPITTGPLRSPMANAFPSDAAAFNMAWEAYGSAVDDFASAAAPNPLSGETGPGGGGGGGGGMAMSGPAGIAPYADGSLPVPRSTSGFAGQQHQQQGVAPYEPALLPYESAQQQPFNPAAYPTNGYMQTAVPLQDYMPP